MSSIKLLRKYCRGFSLLEISVALTIIGILAYGLANSIKIGRDFDKYNLNRELLIEAKTALLAFVQSNGYLPCPDGAVTIDGIEDRTSGICDFEEGRLPYHTLGLAREDAYGNFFYYAIPDNADSSVAANDPTLMASYFNANSAPVFTLDTGPLAGAGITGSLKVCGENATSCNSSTATADMVELAAVALILSFGDNGGEAWANLGTSSAFNAKEFVNADEDNYFWKDTGSYGTAANVEFDDQLVWITGYEIKYTLVKSSNGLSE